MIDQKLIESAGKIFADCNDLQWKTLNFIRELEVEKARLDGQFQKLLAEYEQTKKELEHLKTTSEQHTWKSIEQDGYPDRYVSVLCYHSYEPVSRNVVAENMYYGGGIWMQDGAAVTHWMPLPKAPNT